MQRYVTVYADQVDVTGWLDSVTWQNADEQPYMQADLRFRGWHSVPLGARFDVFGTNDPSNPRQEPILIDGWIPPESYGETEIARGEVTSLSVRVLDWAARALRLSPRNTLVLVDRAAEAQLALDEYSGTVGTPAIVTGIRTMHQAVKWLGRAAGIRVQLAMPDYTLKASVVPPASEVISGKGVVISQTMHYWDAILSLAREYKPMAYALQTSRTVVLEGQLARHLGAGRTMTFSKGSIVRYSGRGLARSVIRRLLVRMG